MAGIEGYSVKEFIDWLWAILAAVIYHIYSLLGSTRDQVLENKEKIAVNTKSDELIAKHISEKFSDFEKKIDALIIEIKSMKD